MKIKIYLLSVFALIAYSCEDYLDQAPQGLLTQDVVFDNDKTARKWVANCYSYIPVNHLSIGYPYGGGPNFQGGWNAISDELDYTGNFAGGGYWADAVQKGNWSASSPTSDQCNYWASFYQAIRQIHLFLNSVHESEGYTKKEVESAKLEVRFLRAYYYAYLIQVYGAVPLILDELSFNEKIDLQRTPYDEIVTWLDGELKDLAEKLPLNNLFGKPTKGAALAVRARMLLYAARPLLNGNSDFAGLNNPDGTPIFNTVYDKEKWKKAVDATKDLFDLGIYDLNKEYYNGKIDPYTSLISTFFNAKNQEIIFARTDDAQNWNWDSFCTPPTSHADDYNSLGFVSITQEAIDAFYTKNGLDIKADPAYSESGFSDSKSYADNTQWESVPGEKGLLAPEGTYNMYVNREPRFYVDVMFNGQLCPQSSTVVDFNSWGGAWYHNQTGYAPRKMVNPEFYGIYEGNLYRPVVLYRLAEFYLAYAEALNEYEPGNSDILRYVNMVRERAGIPELPSSLLSDQVGMRKAILRERQVELFCESLRYFDITQWKLGDEVLNKDFHSMNINTVSSEPATDAFYQRVTYEKRTFKSNFNLFPIPFDEVNKSKSLVQNPGW